MVFTRRFVTMVVAAGLLAVGWVTSRGQQPDPQPAGVEALRDGFETQQTSWVREYTDTTIRMLAHDRSNRAAHGGRLSEHFHFEAGNGSQFFVSYSLPKTPVTTELKVGLHVRSNKQGVRLFAKVVLPADLDPETKAPSYVLLTGTAFSRTDRWETLELTDLMPAIERQVRVLRVSTRRPVSLEGAYLEQVVVNLMGGTGETEVFLDDLEVSPVSHELAAAWTDKDSAARSATSNRKGRTAARRGEPELPPFRLSRNLLERLTDDRRYVGWLPTAIDAPDADIVQLRRAGFDVLHTSAKPDPQKIRAAVDMGFFLLPRLDDADEEKDVLDQMTEYPARKDVLLWQLGEHLGRQRKAAARKQELDQIREVLSAMRGQEAESSHLSTATIDSEYRLYARSPSNLDIIGVEPPVWGTSQSMMDGFIYLNQRRDLTVRSNPEAMFWAWIPTSVPPGVTQNIWGRDTPPDWGTPQVQPEQVRLITYMALAAGYRGLTFLGDADLTRPAGEANLIELTLLNAEINLCEPILARNVKQIKPYGVFDPDPLTRPTTANVNQRRMPLVKETEGGKPGLIAAPIYLDENRGMLLVVADFVGGSQWVPSQLAYHNLTFYPRLQAGAQVLQISPGDARIIESKQDDRVPGGTRVTLPDFGVTTLLLCTNDLDLCRRIQAAVRRIRPQAVALAIRQAEIQYQAVKQVHERLKADGHLFRSEKDLKQRDLVGIVSLPPDAADLLAQSEKFLKNARAARDNEDYSQAWSEARRAGRPLRIVMSGYWAQAIAELSEAATLTFNPKLPDLPEGVLKPYPRPAVIITPISCPPGISFFTLPQLHIWKDWVKGRPGYRFGANRVPSGSFDDRKAISEGGWMDVSFQDDNVVQQIGLVSRREPPQKKEPEKTQQTKGKKEVRFEDEVIADSDHSIKLTVSWKNRLELDTLGTPFLDFPMAAIRSPAIRVQANNLIRISVLVKRSIPTTPGLGGIIVRDSIGGEPFQFRLSDPIPGYARVVLYRKAPADMTFSVTLGLAGYGEVFFDDFRVQVMEADPRFPAPDPNLVHNPGRRTSRPGLPDPRLPVQSASRPSDLRRPPQ
jgi:hypothetical protein